MRTPTLTAAGVEVGGINRPPLVVDQPPILSRLFLWATVVGFVVLWGMVIVAVPRILLAAAGTSQRVTVGDVTFIPAPGWATAPNAPQAPTDAVTYADGGATFTLWTQPGSDTSTTAKEVTSQFFPEAYQAGDYFVTEGLTSTSVRPKQPAKGTEVSQVIVTGVDSPSTIGVPLSFTNSGQLVVQVWAGPESAAGADARLDLTAMSKSIAPKSAS